MQVSTEEGKKTTICATNFVKDLNSSNRILQIITTFRMMTPFLERGVGLLNSYTNGETHYFLLEAAGLEALLHRHAAADCSCCMKLHEMLLIHFILQLSKEMLQ